MKNQICPRCGIIHNQDPVDPEKIISDHATSIAREIDQQVMAGARIHAGDGGYRIGTTEGYNAFIEKRNQFLPEHQKSIPVQLKKSIPPTT